MINLLKQIEDYKLYSNNEIVKIFIQILILKYFLRLNQIIIFIIQLMIIYLIKMEIIIFFYIKYLCYKLKYKLIELYIL